LIAILILVERKLLALSQRRIGPILLGRRGILQIVADVIKPLFKEIFEQKFQAVTLISFGIFLLLFSQLVYMSLFQFGLGFSFLDGAELVILLQLFFGGLSCLSVLFIGFMSGTKYGLIGAVRLVIAEISSETMISLANLIIYINVCSFDYESIMYNQACVSNITIFGIIFAVAHLIQLFLTASRAPLDLIENEGELVAGYNTEFSGPDVLVIYFAEYLHIFNGTLQFIFLLFGCCFVAYFDSNLFICTYDFLY
jgi:NADH-quinone oxidoreductase subunit H